MRTELCERLGIEVPICQAPIGGSAGAPLAAAVSNAGGLGTLAITGFGAEVARGKIREVRERTSKPFAINLLMSFPHEEELEVCLEERVPAVSFFGAIRPATWNVSTPPAQRFCSRSAASRKHSERSMQGSTLSSRRGGRLAGMSVATWPRCRWCRAWSMPWHQSR